MSSGKWRPFCLGLNKWLISINNTHFRTLYGEYHCCWRVCVSFWGGNPSAASEFFSQMISNAQFWCYFIVCMDKFLSRRWVNGDFRRYDVDVMALQRNLTYSSAAYWKEYQICGIYCVIYETQAFQYLITSSNSTQTVSCCLVTTTVVQLQIHVHEYRL